MNNNNNNIQLSDVLRHITSKYNLLRIYLFDLMNYYSTVQNYYIQYLKFVSFVKDKYPILVSISQTKVKTFTIPYSKKYENKRKQLKLQPNTILIIGLSNYYKYISIKHIMNEIINYDKKLHTYLIYLETCIVRFINGINNFNRFYTYSLNILFNAHYHHYYQNNDDLLSNTFKQLKQNHLSKYAPYLNR